MKRYIKMCIEAKEIQELLKDFPDRCMREYCTLHKCFITEDNDGCPVCSGFMDKYRSLSHKNGEYKELSKVEEEKYGFGSDEDCEWNKKWICIFSQSQLQWEMKSYKLPPSFPYHGKSCHNLTYAIGLWLIENWGDVIEFKSFEELWLAFVMMKKYNKFWNKKKEEWQILKIKKGD